MQKNHDKKLTIFIICTAIFGLVFSAVTAFASSYLVHVSQEGVQEQSVQIICNQNKQPCIQDIPVLPDQEWRGDPMKMAVIFDDNKYAILRFKWASINMHVNGQNKVRVPLSQDGVSKTTVNVYLPHPDEAGDSGALLFRKPLKRIASYKITILSQE